MPEPQMNLNRPEDGPLESWKEIAAYLQRNSVTARRWEKEEGLPVHRHSHKSRSSVYAYPSEIDAWRASRKVATEPAQPAPLWRRFLTPSFALTMVLCLVMVGNGIRPQVVAAQGTQTARQIWVGETADMSGSISSDGRFVSFTDWSNGDLSIRDLAVGQVKRLAANQYADSSLLSPDQQQVMYSSGGTPRGSADIRLIANTADSKPRVLLENPDVRRFVLMAWSHDGRSILAGIHRQDRTVQLAWISTQDGSTKVLKSFGWVFPLMASLSPDGGSIAYSIPNSLESGDSSIYLLAADGSRETTLVKSAGTNEGPIWSPDGVHVFFSSNRSGTFGLWSLAVRDGKAAGEPTLVKRDIGRISAKGFTSDGSFHYVAQHGGTDIWEAELNSQVKARGPGSLSTVSLITGSLISERYVGSNQFAEWSPDGKRVSFLRTRICCDGGQDLVVRDLESGHERLYSAVGVPAAALQRAVWFRDGKSLLQIGYDSQVRSVLYRVDLASGEFKKILTLETHPPMTSRWALSANEKTIYGQTDSRVLSAIDLATGDRRDIFVASEKDYIFSLSLSPNGDRLAFKMRTSGGLFVAGTDGRGLRELYSPPKGHVLGTNQAVVWTPDGRSIVFIEAEAGSMDSAFTANGKDWRLMRIPAEGGTPEFLGISSKTMRQLALKPDGSRLAYTDGDPTSAEWWALDNVLGAPKPHYTSLESR